MLTKRPILSLVFSLYLITGGGTLLQLAYANANDLEGYIKQHRNGLSDTVPAGNPMEGPVDDYLGGLWLEFSFDSDWENWAKGCRPAGTGHVCLVGDNALLAIDSPWNFTAPPGGVKLTVTDAFLFGDIFAVYDFGNLIGTTSDINTNNDDGCGPNPDDCLGVASSGTFTLSPGPHSITIKNQTNPFKAGAAYFRIDALDHLVCYQIKKLPKQKFKKSDVRIDNQFGWMDVRIIRPHLLCVPSTKEHLYENGGQ